MRARERRSKGPSSPQATTMRERVVVEGGDGAEQWIIARAIEKGGFDVARCGRPTEIGGRCPLLTGRSCNAIKSADVVVNLLGIRSRDGEDILRAVRAAAPNVGIVTQATALDCERHSALLAECACTVVSPRASASEITSAVLRAAADRAPTHRTQAPERSY